MVFHGLIGARRLIAQCKTASDWFQVHEEIAPPPVWTVMLPARIPADRQALGSVPSIHAW
jgi:hypothetical protein